LNSTIFITVAILVVFVALWGLSISLVWAASGARRLPRVERLFWAALAAALPLVGALLYPLSRALGFVTAPPRSDSSYRRESTDPRMGSASVFGPAPDLFAAVEPQPAASGTLSSPPAAGYGRLVVVQGPSAGLAVDLVQLPARIGRGEGNLLRLEADGKVSRQHAEVFEHAGALVLRDLNSLHGTRVNGAPVREQRLSPGDTISIGDSVIAAELVR
jgi:hypothetical protein